MTFRLRLFLLAVLPFMLVTGVVTWISFKEVKSLSDEQIRIVSEKLRDSKQATLKDYINLALTAITPIIQDQSLDEVTAQLEVKRILNKMSYGSDGYFFVYDKQGVNLVHPIQTELVGQNLYSKQDKQGDQVIKALLEIAANGGGFHQYYWNKPSTKIEEQKIAYAVRLPRWDWMLGSGLYLDDIADEEELIRQKVAANIERNISIILLIVTLTTLLIILFLLTINLHEGRLADRRIRELAKNFVRFQIEERRHFSRELHDGINQLMVAVKFRMELALKQIKQQRVSGCDLDNIAAGLDMIQEAIREVRRISHALRPGLLDKMGLQAAIEDLLEQFKQRTGTITKSNITLGARTSLPEEVEITLYRVIQEALTNIERHANAKQIGLTLEQKAKQVGLTLEDDGQGFSPDAKTDGIGLTNLRERVELIGGDFTVESTFQQGTRIKVALPYRPETG